MFFSCHDLVPISVTHIDNSSPDLKKLLPKIGFYFGTYQSHGWEIIDVHFSDDGNFLEGHKITVFLEKQFRLKFSTGSFF